MPLLRTSLCLLLTACHLPDRYSVTGGSTLGGGLDSAYNGERDFDSQWLEVGVSGPLGRTPEPRVAPMPPIVIQPGSPPTGAPIESGGLPWVELALLLGGAGAMKGGEMGYRKVQSMRASAE